MQPLGLLALGLLAAQAYKITMFAGLDCTGESHAETDPTKACKTPLGLPAEFDARSIKVEDTPLDCQIWMFTDKSLRCDSYQDNTWRFWTKVNEGGCRPTNRKINGSSQPQEGKWQKPYVYCPP